MDIPVDIPFGNGAIKASEVMKFNKLVEEYGIPVPYIYIDYDSAIAFIHAGGSLLIKPHYIAWTLIDDRTDKKEPYKLHFCNEHEVKEFWTNQECFKRFRGDKNGRES